MKLEEIIEKAKREGHKHNGLESGDQRLAQAIRKYFEDEIIGVWKDPCKDANCDDCHLCAPDRTTLALKKYRDNMLEKLKGGE